MGDRMIPLLLLALLLLTGYSLLSMAKMQDPDGR